MRIHSAAALCLLASFGVLTWACGSDDPASATSSTDPGATSSGGGGVGPGDTTNGPSGGAATSSGAVSVDGGTGGVSSGADGGDPPEPPPRPYTDYQINHLLFTGQSNSVSNGGTPVLTKTQPYGNLMFNTGVMPMYGCGGEGCVGYDTPNSFVPLVEGDTFFYPVETAASSIANEISFLAQPKKHDVLVSLHGRSGNTYSCLRKGGCNYKPGLNHPFTQGMQEVTSGMQIAQKAGKSYVVRGVANIHGESDHYSYTAGKQEFPADGTDGTPGKIKDYADALLEWQTDYENGVKEITHQTEPVPMFISQLSGWNDAKTSKVAQFQLDAHIRAPGKVILIGAAYDLSLSQEDCRHFTTDGQQHLGELFGKVYAKVVLEGKTWEPVRPKTIVRNGTEITVQFFVPEPPLTFDTTLVAEMKDKGFEYLDGAGNVATISKVELTGADTVKITLATDVGPGHLTYGQNQPVGTCIGTPRGSRGNLRDSDSTASQHGFPLYNWSVAFDQQVP